MSVIFSPDGMVSIAGNGEDPDGKEVRKRRPRKTGLEISTKTDLGLRWNFGYSRMGEAGLSPCRVGVAEKTHDSGRLIFIKQKIFLLHGSFIVMAVTAGRCLQELYGMSQERG
jgi:hypothetical protein